MTKFRITYIDDRVEEYDIDTYKISNDALSLKRAYYNGGIQDTIKGVPLVNVRSWEWVQ